MDRKGKSRNGEEATQDALFDHKQANKGRDGKSQDGGSQPWGTGARKLSCRKEGSGKGWAQSQSQRG